MTEDVHRIIGSNISRLRRMLDLSEKDLAGILGVPITYIEKYEAGIYAFTPEMLLRLSMLFKCSLDYLCGFEVYSPSGKGVDPDQEFAGLCDFDKVQALIRHFFRIPSPELRGLVYELVKRVSLSHTRNSKPPSSHGNRG
jgi:transcriptional regulator with XRE-family HTH domain